jgi:hypothetical protein
MNPTIAITFGILTCGPLAITLYGWTRLRSAETRQAFGAISYWALGVSTFNSIFAAFTFIYYRLKPPASPLPPWHDPLTLNLALLFLLAPVAIILGIVAAVKAQPGWLIYVVEIASVPLFWIGLLACSSV